MCTGNTNSPKKSRKGETEHFKYNHEHWQFGSYI